MVPRPLAARFACLSTRTLKNHEGKDLTPIRRNARSISYRREQLLEFLGLTEPQPKRRPRRRAAA